MQLFWIALPLFVAACEPQPPPPSPPAQTESPKYYLDRSEVIVSTGSKPTGKPGS